MHINRRECRENIPSSRHHFNINSMAALCHSAVTPASLCARQSDETFSALALLERKLATLEGNNWALRETAADRRALGEYEPIREQAIAVCSDINGRLVELIRSNRIPT